MSDLLLVRHAEPQAALEQRFDDTTGLSQRGREQARALGRALAQTPLRGCLSSPLARARETAELVLEGRGVEIELLDQLREGSIGDLAGLSRAAAALRFPEQLRFGVTVGARLAASGYTAPGGETRSVFLERAARAGERLGEELSREGDALLVVAHGGLLSGAIAHLLARPARDDVPFGFEFCGLVRVIAYRESEAKAEGYGGFPMLVFGAP